MDKPQTFEAQLDIVNLGIYLKEKGLFEGRTFMMVLYLFVLIATVGSQIYLTVVAYKQVDFIAFVKILLKLNKDRQAQKECVCEQNHPSMYLGTLILFMIILCDMSDKMVLLFCKKRKFIFKVLLFVQVMTSVSILQCSLTYVFN